MHLENQEYNGLWFQTACDKRKPLVNPNLCHIFVIRDELVVNFDALCSYFIGQQGSCFCFGKFVMLHKSDHYSSHFLFISLFPIKLVLLPGVGMPDTNQHGTCCDMSIMPCSYQYPIGKVHHDPHMNTVIKSFVHGMPILSHNISNSW